MSALSVKQRCTMTKLISGNPSVVERQSQVAADTELMLLNCATAIESRDFERAKKLVDTTARMVGKLEQFKRNRRGQPLEDLREVIMYYSAWQIASAGRLEITKGDYVSKVGFDLLEEANRMASELSRKHKGTPEYAKLRRRIKAWKLAAQQHRVEPAGV